MCVYLVKCRSTTQRTNNEPTKRRTNNKTSISIRVVTVILFKCHCVGVCVRAMKSAYNEYIYIRVCMCV